MEKHAHVMMITQTEVDREYYISFDTGSQLFDWFQVIRSSRLRLVEGRMGTKRTASMSISDLAGECVQVDGFPFVCFVDLSFSF